MTKPTKKEKAALKELKAQFVSHIQIHGVKDIVGKNDLAMTPGFEKFRDELVEFQEIQEALFLKRKYDRSVAAGCPGNFVLLDRLEMLEKRLEVFLEVYATHTHRSFDNI